MSKTAVIVIIGATIFESLIIIIGNLFTIFVFWKHRNNLKRTSFLLINLAAADLLVGLTEPIVLGTYKIPHELEELSINSTGYGHISIILQTTFSFASVFFLVLISLERAYALIWPLRHRVANTKGYIYGVIFVWLAAISTSLLSLLAVHGVLDYADWIVACSAMVILCLITICVSYLAIRTRLNCRVPAIDAAHNRQNGPEQNAKLSRTLFIVIGASLVCWLPSMAFYPVHYICSECAILVVVYVSNMFRLANSIVNPIIYSFRISMFRETIKRIKFRRHSKQYRVNYKP
ncbi:G-protein coupled estrogen receptor 1-like [Oculina patagonica]